MNIIVWSKENCSYCIKAKEFLKARGLAFEERKIDGVTWTKEQLLEAAPLARTVPQIFIDGRLVGGFNELHKELTNV